MPPCRLTKLSGDAPRNALPVAGAEAGPGDHHHQDHHYQAYSSSDHVIRKWRRGRMESGQSSAAGRGVGDSLGCAGNAGADSSLDRRCMPKPYAIWKTHRRDGAFSLQEQLLA